VVNLLAQTWMNLFVIQHVPSLVFVFCFGACVGSFINVVIYRLPAGMSVVMPPSRCPTCGARLKFIPENLPILGWLIVRGRCRHCGVKVSAQYMVVELLMALLFSFLYIALFMAPSWDWWPDWLLAGDTWWRINGPWRTWPVFIPLAFLLAGLIAMTLIDARTFTIPIQIPVVVTVTAFAAYALQGLLPLQARTLGNWPIQVLCWPGCGLAFGAMLGVGLSCLLLRMGVFRYSFHDYEKYVKEGEILADYPHARREMVVELVFLAPCLIGATAGWFAGGIAAGAAPPVVVQALAGSFAGYLMGGALVWGIRIIATLVIGREAMGLGDVHLLGAVGAVLGWFDPILVFFVAPFSGIFWALLSKGLSTVLKKRWSELPYGPHLAVATLVVILLRPGLQAGWIVLFPGFSWPATTMCPAPAAQPVSPAPASPPSQAQGARPGQGQPPGGPLPDDGAASTGAAN